MAINSKKTDHSGERGALRCESNMNFFVYGEGEKGGGVMEGKMDFFFFFGGGKERGK